MHGVPTTGEIGPGTRQALFPCVVNSDDAS